MAKASKMLDNDAGNVGVIDDLPVEELENEPEKPKRGPKARITQYKTQKPAEKTTAAVPSALEHPETCPEGVDFWDWKSGFSAEDWGRYLIAYLWRTSPLTDRLTNGKASAIGKYAMPFDLETIRHDHGSGGYRVDICKLNPRTKKQTRIHCEYFSIMNMDYPPRVPAGDWLNDPANEMWKWAEKALKAQTARAASVVDEVTGAAAGNPAALMDAVERGVTLITGRNGGNDQMTSLIVQMLERDRERAAAAMDPTKQLTTIREMMVMLTPKSDSSSDKLFELMRDELRTMREEVTRLRSAPAPKGLIEQLIDEGPKLETAMTLLGFKKTTAVRKSDGLDWNEIAKSVAGPMFEFLASRQPPQAAAPGQPTMPLPSPTTPAPAPAPAAPSAWNQSPVASAPQTEEQRLTDAFKRHEHMIRSIIGPMAKAFNQNESGYAFRDWFFAQHGDDGRKAWSEIKAEIGANGIASTIESNFMLNQMMNPPEDVLAFLEDFFTEPGEEREDALNDETEPGEPE